MKVRNNSDEPLGNDPGNETPGNGNKTPRGPRGRRRVVIAIAVTALGVAIMGGLALVAVSQNGVVGSRSNAANANCVASPSLCGFPDTTNAGVPSGTVLKTVPGQVSSGPGWKYDPRGWVEVSGSNVTLNGLYIPYNLDINSGSNVTIKDVQVVTGGKGSWGISVRHTKNLTIEDSTISGTNASSGRVTAAIKDMYADSTGLSVLNNNIYDAGVGVQMESGLIQGNYIHNMGFITGDHIDGINSDGGDTGLLTIQDNTVLVDHDQTCAIGLFEDFGSQTNRVVNNNLLAGGSYTIYGGQNTGGAAATNIKITNNRISDMYYPKGGDFGPVTAFSSSGSGNTWSGNIWDSNGQTISSP